MRICVYKNKPKPFPSSGLPTTNPSFCPPPSRFKIEVVISAPCLQSEGELPWPRELAVTRQFSLHRSPRYGWSYSTPWIWRGPAKLQGATCRHKFRRKWQCALRKKTDRTEEESNTSNGDRATAAPEVKKNDTSRARLPWSNISTEKVSLSSAHVSPPSTWSRSPYLTLQMCAMSETKHENIGSLLTSASTLVPGSSFRHR